MSVLSWGTPGERFYESGIDRGVLYVDDAGFAWNGLISVQEKASGGEPTPYYLDGYKYVQVMSTEEFEATLEAFSSPHEFGPCDGATEFYAGLTVTQQRRKQFSLSYRNRVGNDVDGLDHGYKIHLVYNALAGPSDRNNQTIKATVDPSTLSWDITTQPPLATGFRPTSHFVIDSRTADPEVLSALEDILYGTEDVDSALISVSDLLTMFS